jgi:hypothetical protein
VVSAALPYGSNLGFLDLRHDFSYITTWLSRLRLVLNASLWLVSNAMTIQLLWRQISMMKRQLILGSVVLMLRYLRSAINTVKDISSLNKFEIYSDGLHNQNYC